MTNLFTSFLGRNMATYCARMSVLSARLSKSTLQVLPPFHSFGNCRPPPLRLFSLSTKRPVDFFSFAAVAGNIGRSVMYYLKLLPESVESKRYVYDLPREPRHFIQLRNSEVKQLKSKFLNLEQKSLGNVANTVYITGEPGTGKTELARQFGRKFFEENKNPKLFVGTLNADSRSRFLQKYLAIALDLGCVNQYTELAIRSGHLDEQQTLYMLLAHVKKELRERPGWLLIVDGLSLDEKLVQELSSFWPQPNERESWGKGYVLVTTQGRPPTRSSEMDLRKGMLEDDAVGLLANLSDSDEKEGALELVESLNRSPLSIVRYVFKVFFICSPCYCLTNAFH